MISANSNNDVVLYDARTFKGNYIDNRNNSKKSLSAPLYLDVYPSFICNYNCIFCYNKLIPKDMNIMSKSTVDNIIKYAKEKGIYWINILGGEPLHPFVIDITKYLITEGVNNNIKMDITTNGKFIDKSVIDFMIKNNVTFNISFFSRNKTKSKII